MNSETTNTDNVLNIENTIKDALSYYDKNTENEYDTHKHCMFWAMRLQTHNESDPIIITCFDSMYAEVFSSRYECLGTYDNMSSTWTWAWSISTLPKMVTNVSKRLLNYGLNLSPTDKLLKHELITSRFKITNKIQIDKYVALASYLSKQKYVHKLHYSPKTDEIDSKKTPYKRIYEPFEEKITLYALILDGYTKKMAEIVKS